MMSCRQFTASLTDYMEGNLPIGSRMGIVLHSMMCQHCRRYLAQMREVVRVAASAEDFADEALEPAEQEDELVAAFRASQGAAE